MSKLKDGSTKVAPKASAHIRATNAMFFCGPRVMKERRLGPETTQNLRLPWNLPCAKKWKEVRDPRITCRPDRVMQR